MKERGFTKIDNKMLETIISADLNATEYAVLLALIRYTKGYQRPICRMSYGRLAKLTNKSISSVKKAVNYLFENNFIGRISSRLSTELSTNAYMIMNCGIENDTETVL